MELIVTRRWLTPNTSIGELTINGHHQCFTLEDYRRPKGEPKVPGETAIPEGRYEVKVEWSDAFKRLMPRLKGVPGFEGILIHTGNDKDDTRGCVLVGLGRDVDKILNSRVAFEALFAKIEGALDGKDQVFITIKTAADAERAVC